MGTTLHIRDARDGDLAALQAVTLAAYQDYAAVMPPAAWECGIQGSKLLLASLLVAFSVPEKPSGAILALSNAEWALDGVAILVAALTASLVTGLGMIWIWDRCRQL